MALSFLVAMAYTSAAQGADAGADLRRHHDETWRFIKPAAKSREAPLPLDPRRSEAAAAASAAKVFVTAYQVRGVTLLSEAEVNEVLAPFTDKELDTRGLQEAALALQTHYRRKSFFLAKVLIPPQTFHDTVLFEVLEGRFDEPAVEVINKGTLNRTEAVQSILERYMVAGDVVHGDDVERSLLLAEDLPGVRISNLLYPGQTVGTARMRTVISDEPQLTGNVDVDNFGSRDTGQTRLGTTLYINSPSGVGDQVIVRLVTSGAGSNYGYAQYLRPVAPNGLRLGVSIDGLRYRSDFYANVGTARGTATDWRVLAHYPMLRSRYRNSHLRLELGQTRVHDRNDLGLDANRTLSTASLSVYGDRTHDFWADGTTYYDVGVTAGQLKIRGNDAYRSYDRLGPQAAGQFSRLSFNVQRLQHLSGPWSAHVKLAGQVASSNLESSLKMHLGGGTSVSGYPVGQASGDSGWELHAELRRDISMNGNGRLHGFVYAQHGEVRQHHRTWAGWQAGNPGQSNTQSLSTVGIGLVHNIEGIWLIRGMLGHQVGRNALADPATDADADGRTRNWRLWFQAIRYF